MRDYAKMEWMNSWLRHPVLGDPSFDTFEKIGPTVHRSEPPYEWAVNGSLFRDFDDTWYYYAGLYPYGYYNTSVTCRFRTYRSTDRGATWEDLGWGFPRGHQYDGEDQVCDVCPDCVLSYDETLKKYILAHDGRGVSYALADSPAGPFQRSFKRILRNDEIVSTSGGRYNRFYATTIYRRKNDYIAFILCDSDQHFSWGLAFCTAPTLEGPWTVPHLLLNCDRPEYYPCPLEFYPAELHNGIVYCSATSVAMNRNYQAVFEAPLEEADDPSAWKMTADGNVWHAHDDPDEHYGIWGQTYHGFIEPDTGRYVVMYPAKDTRDFGTLSVAARPWDKPHSDGFTATGHAGETVSPILTAYADFTLDTKFTARGTVDFAFAYEGILGPNESRFNSVPADTALRNYAAIRVQENTCRVLHIAPDGTETVYATQELSVPVTALCADWKNGALTLQANGETVCTALKIPEAAGKTAPIAIVLQKFSRLECSQFAVTGNEQRYRLVYNAVDALLGAGQWNPEPELVQPDDDLALDVWHRMPGGYVGEGLVAAKWNVIGDSFELPLQKNPAYGMIGIWIDGIFSGSVNLCGEGTTAWRAERLKMGRHSVRVAPIKGRIAITTLTVSGF